MQTECAIPTDHGKEKPLLAPLRSESPQGIWQPPRAQAETKTETQGPGHGDCPDLRTRLLRTTERKSSMNLLSFRDVFRAHLGISINLQIYPKFSKFAMTNVTVPLHRSSSLGSFGGLEKMPATRLGRK